MSNLRIKYKKLKRRMELERMIYKPHFIVPEREQLNHVRVDTSMPMSELDVSGKEEMMNNHIREKLANELVSYLKPKLNIYARQNNFTNEIVFSSDVWVRFGKEELRDEIDI